jgi:hypothetical protein
MKTHPAVTKFFHESAQTLANLYVRWLDERQYEDLADYLLPFKAIAADCKVNVYKMQKSPFGVVIGFENSKFLMYLKGDQVILRSTTI